MYDAIYSTGSVSGAEAINNAITTLKAAIEQGEVSLSAKAKLDKMKELIDATNVYTAEAKAEYYDQWVVKYTDGSITKAEVNALQDPFLTTGWRANTTVDNFLLSAWDTNPDFQDAAYYINTWSTEGDTDGSNFKVPFFEYFGNPLPAKTLTATMNGLEPGKYEHLLTRLQRQPRVLLCRLTKATVLTYAQVSSLTAMQSVSSSRSTQLLA